MNNYQLIVRVFIFSAIYMLLILGYSWGSEKIPSYFNINDPQVNDIYFAGTDEIFKNEKPTKRMCIMVIDSIEGDEITFKVANQEIISGGYKNFMKYDSDHLDHPENFKRTYHNNIENLKSMLFKGNIVVVLRNSF